MDVGISEFALFMVSGFLENVVILEKWLHCSGWLFRLVFSGLEVWLVVATWMQSGSLRRALVLLLLRFLLCRVGVVEVGCLVRCLLWRLVGPVCCACFLALCGARAIRVRK